MTAESHDWLRAFLSKLKSTSEMAGEVVLHKWRASELNMIFSFVRAQQAGVDMYYSSIVQI